MSTQASSQLLLQVGSAVVQVVGPDAELGAWLATTLGDLRTDSAAPTHRLEIGTTAEQTALTVDGTPYYSSIDRSNVIDHLVSWCNQQAVVSRPHMVNLHAAGVASAAGDKCIVLPGVPGAGKSSISAAAAKAGWGYLSDEMISLGPDGVAHGYPKPITIKTGGKGLVDFDYSTQTISTRQNRWYVKPSALGSHVVAAAPVHALVFSKFDPDNATLATDVSTADAVLELAANCQDELDAQGTALEILANLAAGTINVALTQRNLGEALDALSEVATRDAPSPGPVQFLRAPSPTDPAVGPKVKADAVGVAVDGGVVVHQATTQTLVALDPLAGAIWQLLDGTASQDQLVDELAQTFGHPPNDVANDVGVLLDQLRGHGLVTG